MNGSRDLEQSYTRPHDIACIHVLKIVRRITKNRSHNNVVSEVSKNASKKAETGHSQSILKQLLVYAAQEPVKMKSRKIDISWPGLVDTGKQKLSKTSMLK
jgi:hypothetical protein